MLTPGYTLPRLLLSASLLTLLAACSGGGGGSIPPATRLVYANDPGATTADWRVEVDPVTNGTATVLLRVYGPTGAAIQGATVFLSSDATHSPWVQPAGATDPYALPAGALDLAQGPNEGLQLFKSHLIASDLQVAVYQKTGTTPLTADHPLFCVALGLAPGTAPGAANLSPTANRTSVYQDGTGEHPLTLKVGTLIVR